MTGVALLTAVLTIVGIYACGRGVMKLKQRRLVAASHRLFPGTCSLAVALALGGAAFNLHTYARLTYEKDLAELMFRELGQQRFEVTLTLMDSGDARQFSLAGDEWQLDARVLKFHGLANLAGFDTHYRLDRLSGRYRNVEAELSQPRTIYSLTESERGFDLWLLANELELPWVDASYGSATYLPMRDQARFKVHLTQSGLLARPVNSAGEEAIRIWSGSG